MKLKLLSDVPHSLPSPVGRLTAPLRISGSFHWPFADTRGAANFGFLSLLVPLRASSLSGPDERLQGGRICSAVE